MILGLLVFASHNVLYRYPNLGGGRRLYHHLMKLTADLRQNKSL